MRRPKIKSTGRCECKPSDGVASLFCEHNNYTTADGWQIKAEDMPKVPNN